MLLFTIISSSSYHPHPFVFHITIIPSLYHPLLIPSTSSFYHLQSYHIIIIYFHHTTIHSFDKSIPFITSSLYHHIIYHLPSKISSSSLHLPYYYYIGIITNPLPSSPILLSYRHHWVKRVNL